MSLVHGHTLIADVGSALGAVKVDLLLGVGGAHLVGGLVFAGGFDHLIYNTITKLNLMCVLT